MSCDDRLNAPPLSATVLGQLSAVLEMAGDPESTHAQRGVAARVRGGAWLLTTERNCRETVGRLEARGVRLVATQYPLRSVKSLPALPADPPALVFVDTEVTFRDALRCEPWERWFRATFAGDSGIASPKGGRLLARAAAGGMRTAVASPTR